MAVDDAELKDWSELAGESWDGLVVGNGASQAVWSGFGYGSLYDVAQGDELDDRLDAAALGLFAELETTNFERVLAALSTAQAVNHVFGVTSDELQATHERVRNALIGAVHQVHVPWLLAQPALPTINAEISRYDSVFSLNYDLLLYWAVMHDSAPFKDMLWDQPFDPSNADVGGKVTKIHWLHGGLHLYRGIWGGAYKRTATPTANLLDLFGQPWHGRSPLFVSEGTSKDKLRTIHTSDYLSFCFQRLAEHAKALVVFGASLDETDRHVANAVRQHGRAVAISIRPGGLEVDIIEKKAKYLKLLPSCELLFFDAATHPLGASSLQVKEAEVAEKLGDV